MASESTVRSNETSAAGTTEPPSSSAPSRRSDRRIPTARETLATLPEIEGSDFDFEPHDTIPAPPWLDDDSLPPRKQP